MKEPAEQGEFISKLIAATQPLLGDLTPGEFPLTQQPEISIPPFATRLFTFWLSDRLGTQKKQQVEEPAAFLG